MSTRTKSEPGPKPDYLVVEDHLKAQTGEGEISIDLRIPLKKLEMLMEMTGTVEDRKMPRFILDNIIAPEDRDQLENMRDGAKAYGILMEFAKRVAERLGVSVGESSGSTDSSEDTGAPSEQTSEPATE